MASNFKKHIFNNANIHNQTNVIRAIANLQLAMSTVIAIGIKAVRCVIIATNGNDLATSHLGHGHESWLSKKRWVIQFYPRFLNDPQC